MALAVTKRTRRRWTAEKRALAIDLARAGETNDAIARIVGMSAQAVWNLTRGMRDDRRPKPRKSPQRVAVCRVVEVAITPDADADRAARELARDLRDDAALKRGDLTPVFFGDPPPGYSALDRKRA